MPRYYVEHFPRTARTVDATDALTACAALGWTTTHKWVGLVAPVETGEPPRKTDQASDAPPLIWLLPERVEDLYVRIEGDGLWHERDCRRVRPSQAARPVCGGFEAEQLGLEPCPACWPPGDSWPTERGGIEKQHGYYDGPAYGRSEDDLNEWGQFLAALFEDLGDGPDAEGGARERLRREARAASQAGRPLPWAVPGSPWRQRLGLTVLSL